MKILKLLVFASAASGVGALVYHPEHNFNDIPNRIPEPPPYVLAEAKAIAPPFEEFWHGPNNPGQCRTCHEKIFDEWNGSMMANSWRDPVWRAAYLLLSRSTSAHGNCDTPEPPDGTKKAEQNPFADGTKCSSSFDIGSGRYTVSRPGSLLDAFCSRCHMPANYVDNFALKDVKVDPATGFESATPSYNFYPTSDNGTGFAFAELDSQFRNTDSGRIGIFCAVCHSMGATRETPFHNYAKSGTEYYPAVGEQTRAELLPVAQQDMFQPADPTKRNLGYAIGAGAYRLSPHAIVSAERFGPLTMNDPPGPIDKNTSSVFGMDVPYQHMDSSKHKGIHQAMYVRAEMCGMCHDVTNALPLKNTLGKWTGGFPIERTYTEWTNSRYADRPGNSNFDPKFKRDCQSCHMQQEYGQPGTAQTLYSNGHPLPIPSEPVVNDGKPRPFFSHHFVGGNSLVPRLIGKDVDQGGNPSPWPELSVYSFSSADHKSVYSRGFWAHAERKGPYAQQARMAWDRVRHALSVDVTVPATATAGASVPINIQLQNTGAGHDFPTGFPEGRTAWLAVHAYDAATGKELPIHDSVWNRTSIGVGNLTKEEMVDPNFPGCNWEIPPASADPYAPQYKAIASLGDGCPTLALVYATPLNMVANANGMPIDQNGRDIDPSNPLGLIQFKDLNGNGDLFDDSFLRDWRFKPMPQPEATKKYDRYSVVVPPGTRGPISLSTAVYYQSVEAIVAIKFLGNMVDTNNDFILQPCVLGGPCDGRKPTTEPPVVEGSPPVPIAFRNSTIPIEGGEADKTPPHLRGYPRASATRVYPDAVVKALFDRPVRGLDPTTFTLTDSAGAAVPASVDQIGDAVWGLFPNSIVLKKGETYTAHVKAGVCDLTGNCTPKDAEWKFTVAPEGDDGVGDTTIPMGFAATSPLVSTW